MSGRPTMGGCGSCRSPTTFCTRSARPAAAAACPTVPADSGWPPARDVTRSSRASTLRPTAPPATAPGTCSSGSAWRVGYLPFRCCRRRPTCRGRQGPRPARQLRIAMARPYRPRCRRRAGRQRQLTPRTAASVRDVRALLTFPATSGAATGSSCPRSRPLCQHSRRTAAGTSFNQPPISLLAAVQRARHSRHVQVLDRARALASARTRRAGAPTGSRRCRASRVPRRSRRAHRRHHRAGGHTCDSASAPGARLPRTHRGLVLLPSPARHAARLAVLGRGRAQRADPVRRPVLPDGFKRR